MSSQFICACFNEHSKAEKHTIKGCSSARGIGLQWIQEGFNRAEAISSCHQMINNLQQAGLRSLNAT